MFVTSYTMTFNVFSNFVISIWHPKTQRYLHFHIFSYFILYEIGFKCKLFLRSFSLHVFFCMYLYIKHWTVFLRIARETSWINPSANSKLSFTFIIWNIYYETSLTVTDEAYKTCIKCPKLLLQVKLRFHSRKNQSKKNFDSKRSTRKLFILLHRFDVDFKNCFYQRF